MHSLSQTSSLDQGAELSGPQSWLSITEVALEHSLQPSPAPTVKIKK